MTMTRRSVWTVPHARAHVRVCFVVLLLIVFVFFFVLLANKLVVATRLGGLFCFFFVVSVC